jgi:hypothetical protein
MRFPYHPLDLSSNAGTASEIAERVQSILGVPTSLLEEEERRQLLIHAIAGQVEAFCNDAGSWVVSYYGDPVWLGPVWPEEDEQDQSVPVETEK